MEQDRYEVSHKLFITGMICLVLSLSLVLFGFYILPAVLFGWLYDIPAFIFTLIDWLRTDLEFSEMASDWLVLALFFIPGIIAGFIAYYASNKIDNTIYGIGVESEEEIIEERKQKGGWGGTTMTLKVIFLLLIAFLVVTLFEWLLTSLI